MILALHLLRRFLGAAVLCFSVIAAIVFTWQSDPLAPLIELNLSLGLYLLGFMWAGFSTLALWNMARSAGQNWWSHFANSTFILFVLAAFSNLAASATLNTLSTEAYVWIATIVLANGYDLLFQIIWYLKFRGME